MNVPYIGKRKVGSVYAGSGISGIYKKGHDTDTGSTPLGIIERLVQEQGSEVIGNIAKKILVGIGRKIDQSDWVPDPLKWFIGAFFGIDKANEVDTAQVAKYGVTGLDDQPTYQPNYVGAYPVEAFA